MSQTRIARLQTRESIIAQLDATFERLQPKGDGALRWQPVPNVVIMLPPALADAKEVTLDVVSVEAHAHGVVMYIMRITHQIGAEQATVRIPWQQPAQVPLNRLATVIKEFLDHLPTVSTE
ncbi:MAG: hypothetical protein O3B64_01380 [bacterium]|nr:hypothetical protein [bacterium]MDA1024452.1 hypothetical protein [bacterium]